MSRRRDPIKLAATAAVARPFSPVTEFQIDLTVEETLSSRSCSTWREELADWMF